MDWGPPWSQNSAVPPDQNSGSAAELSREKSSYSGFQRDTGPGFSTPPRLDFFPVVIRYICNMFGARSTTILEKQFLEKNKEPLFRLHLKGAKRHPIQPETALSLQVWGHWWSAIHKLLTGEYLVYLRNKASFFFNLSRKWQERNSLRVCQV